MTENKPDTVRKVNYWKNLGTKERRENLYLDALYNRKFLERSRGVLFGIMTGSVLSLALFRIQNRFLLSAVVSGLSCGLLSTLKVNPLHDQYFKLWNELSQNKVCFRENLDKNDELTQEDFEHFYNRYLRVYMAEHRNEA